MQANGVMYSQLTFSDKRIAFSFNFYFWFIGSGKYDSSDVDPDAEAEAVATMCLIATPPEVRAAESKYS